MQTNIVPQWDQLPDLNWKEKVAYLTYEFLKAPQIGCPVEHLFEDGNYIREMRIPAGTLFLGRAHRHGHQCQLVSGVAIQITPEGKRIGEAPITMMTTPGYHMVLYSVTDVVGRTIHPNPEDSRDTEWLERDIFESVESLQALGAELHARQVT